jgi:hypothetical protein
MSLKKINVLRWFNNEIKKKYVIEIYEDDNLEDGISKIAMTIEQEIENKKLGKFYVWNENYKSILYSIENIKWKGYNYNPLKSTDKNNLIIKEPIIYNFNYGLCYFNSINIIFENDFQDLKDNQYYFIDKKFTSFDNLKKRENKLKELETKDISNISNNYSIIHRYELLSNINKKKIDYLEIIYDKLNTNNLIQFIQWINDTYTTINKLYLYHKISHNNLNNWTAIDKNINISQSIICYSLLGENSNSYAKITIDKNINITINYILDLRKNITWEIINKHIKEIRKYLENSLNNKITFKPISIKVHNYINIINVPLENIKTKISLYPQIFDIISSKDRINLIYKRSSNYTNEAFDFSKYIKTRLLLGIDNNEIIEELITFGLTQDEAKNQIKTEQELLGDMEDKMIKEKYEERKLNTIVIIKSNKNGFETIVHNIPNEKEYNNLIYWISKIISTCQEKIKEPKKKNKIEIQEQKSSSPSSLNEDEEELEKLYSSSSSSSKYGGLKDKEDQRYRIQLLQNADKDLFGENYAREKCQKRNQPFVISKDTREKLIKEGKYFVDNDIYYGSKKDKMNYYVCPRLWCKVSKVPADPITGKCPIENDETILSFFDNPNEEGVKRYVKLIKPNENNLCVPCCFKKPPKPEELNKCKNYESYNPENINKANIDEKDENYLVNYPAPINVGRYGIVPQNLHELLYPQIKYKNCSKDLNKSDKCLVRKGIIHKDIKKNEDNIYPDSLIYSLSYLLDFENKKEFIKDIKNKLDLITFLSIENGNVCKAFMDKLPIIPNDNIELIKDLIEHYKQFPFLNNILKIDFTNFNYKLSRILAIFKSYKKFIDYISSNNYNNVKSPYFFFSLISSIYNKLLIVWEKENKGNIIQIICPYYTSYYDLISSLEINPEIIMLLKDNKYFEPLELKSKGKDGIKTFLLENYSILQKLLNKCSTNNIYDYNKNIYNNLYSLNIWTKTKILNNYQKFLIDTIIINNDLTIEHFLTKGNILITIEKIGINFLTRIIKDFNIKNIIFYDDLINNNIIYNINVNIKDLDTFKEKLISLNIKYDIGEIDKSIIQKEPVAEIYTILQLKNKILNNKDIIHTRIQDELYFFDKNNNENNKIWFQLQIMVFTTLLKYLNDDILKKFHNLSRIDYINEITKILDKENKYNNNPYKNKIRLILEEIPIFSIKHIKKYLNKLILYYKYDFLNPIIKINKNQFLFSQVALNNGIPHELINYHISSPSNNFIYTNYDKNEFIFDTDFEDNKNIILPQLFNGEFKKLNSKWTMHKKSKWYDMEIINIKNYKFDYFKEFFQWFANFINIKTSFSNLIDITNNKLKIIKDNEANLKNILKDIKLFKLFNSISCKSFNNVNLFWDNYYSLLSQKDKNEFINKIITNGMPLNDLYILSMAEILNINVLTIHRVYYKSTNDNIIRGDLEDLVLSTTLYKAPINHYNRPLLIFNKDINSITNETIYELVVDKNIPIGIKSIYSKLIDIPNEIKILTEEHLKKFN